MLRHIVAAVLCSLLLPAAVLRADESKHETEKSPPITKEWLLGTWQNPKNKTITLTFRKEGGGTLSVVAFVAGMFSQTNVAFEYVIDAKTNKVKMDQGKAHIGTAERMADGKLRVNAPGDGLVNVAFERIIEGKPKK